MNSFVESLNANVKEEACNLIKATNLVMFLWWLRKKKITKSSDVGREIIEQVLSAFCDTRTEIIGVIYPGMIDDQLKHLLYHEAKVHNKRLVIMDNEFMIKLFDYYIEKHGIMISN